MLLHGQISTYSKLLCVSGSKQYSASIAFTLALFSHLVNHVNIRLQAELEEGESQVPALRSDNAGKRHICLSAQFLTVLIVLFTAGFG